MGLFGYRPRCSSSPLWRVGRLGALLAVLACGLAGAGPARQSAPETGTIRYSRQFKGSQPEFFSISIAATGAAEYEAREQDSDPPRQLAFTATPATCARIFALAAELHDFDVPLDDKGAKEGYTGTKTLAFDGDGRHTEQQFNYTRLRPAQDLTDLFEKIANTAGDALDLRNAIQFDRLGVVDVLNRIEQDWESKFLAEPQLLAPTLQQIVNDPAMMALAQRHARTLLAEIKK